MKNTTAADLLQESIDQAYIMGMGKAELIDFLVNDFATAYMGEKMIAEFINANWRADHAKENN